MAKQTAMFGALVPGAAEALHYLGKQLMRIGKGDADARVVFEQTKNGRPSMAVRDWQIALVYWAARARRAGRERAVKDVYRALPELTNKLKPTAIQKIADKLMVDMIGTESTAGPDEEPNGQAGALEFANPKLDLQALRARVARKAHRGDWMA